MGVRMGVFEASVHSGGFDQLGPSTLLLLQYILFLRMESSLVISHDCLRARFSSWGVPCMGKLPLAVLACLLGSGLWPDLLLCLF